MVWILCHKITPGASNNAGSSSSLIGPFDTASHTAEEAVTAPHASFPTSVGGAEQPITSPATVTLVKRFNHTNTIQTNHRALQPKHPHQQQLQKPTQWPSREEYIPPTPLQLDKLWQLLCHHPQQHRVNYILKGLTDGFSLEYTGPVSFWAPRNLPSAAQFPDLVLQCLNKEIAAGRMLGPFQELLMPDLMCSPLGIVPKKDSTEMRMIMHLSYPYGTSINDFIDKDKALTHYQQFDDTIQLVVKQGRFFISWPKEMSNQHSNWHPLNMTIWSAWESILKDSIMWI